MSLPIDVATAADPFLGGLEASNVELKKSSEGIKRFADPGLKTHPRAGQVNDALKILQPEQLLKVLQSAQGALQKVTPDVEGEMPSVIPRLAQAPFDPVPLSSKDKTNTKDPTLHGTALVYGLLGKIAQLTNDSSLQSLLGQLQVFNASFSGAIAVFNELASQLEKLASQWANDFDALQQAQSQTDNLQQQVTTTDNALNNAQNQLAALQAQAEQQLTDTGIISPSLQEHLNEAKQTLANAQQAAVSAKAAHEHYVISTLQPVQQAEMASKAALQQTQLQAQNVVHSYSKPQLNAIEAQRKQQDDNAKSLEFLMAVIAQLINKSASGDLQASAELKQKLSEAAAKDAENKLIEYGKQVKQAEDVQRTMGCIGKVIGWAITAISVVAAVFTGGASLALAAVGLALALGDEISQATTGVSFMQEAVKPIMEHIVKPLMELMAKYYSTILEAVGFSKETAAMVGQIMGAIAAAVILIAGAVVAGKAMSKLVGMLVEKVGATVAGQVTKEMTKKMVQKMLDSSVGQLFKRMNAGLGRSLGMNEIGLAKISTGTKMAQHTGALGNTLVQTAGSVTVAGMMVEAEKSKAQLLRDITLQEILNTLLDHVVDKFAQMLAVMRSILENMASAAENRMKAGKYTARKIGSVAG